MERPSTLDEHSPHLEQAGTVEDNYLKLSQEALIAHEQQLATLEEMRQTDNLATDQVVVELDGILTKTNTQVGDIITLYSDQAYWQLSEDEQATVGELEFEVAKVQTNRAFHATELDKTLSEKLDQPGNDQNIRMALDKAIWDAANNTTPGSERYNWLISKASSDTVKAAMLAAQDKRALDHTRARELWWAKDGLEYYNQQTLIENELTNISNPEVQKIARQYIEQVVNRREQDRIQEDNVMQAIFEAIIRQEAMRTEIGRSHAEGSDYDKRSKRRKSRKKGRKGASAQKTRLQGSDSQIPVEENENNEDAK